MMKQLCITRLILNNIYYGASREERAVETFNAASDDMAEYKRLDPTAISACPHVALAVLPRQMVEHGDPTRRGTDHSES